jgi:hypothetical protein
MPRHFAALGLARCNRLLKAILTLYEQCLQDVEGVVVRPIFELMLSSLYSLYGGEGVYDEIRGQYVGEIEKLPDEGGLADAKRDLIENWEGLGSESSSGISPGRSASSSRKRASGTRGEF